MPTPTRTEYVDLDGIPLATAAWDTTSLIELWDTADLVGADLTVPHRRGVIPFRRSYGGKRVNLPIVIYGDADSDGGSPASPGRPQLWANRNELLGYLHPPTIGIAGTRTLRYHAPDGTTISGPAVIIGRLRPTPVGPAAMRAALELNLVEGGLRDDVEVDVTSSEASGGGFVDLVVPNPGTDYQDDLTLTLTGTATSVTLTNLTADAGGAVALSFGGVLDTGVTIDTGDFTAIRAGLPVAGLVDFIGFERWLPLVPGANTIRIEPLGGTATLQVQHRPFYA